MERRHYRGVMPPSVNEKPSFEITKVEVVVKRQTSRMPLSALSGLVFIFLNKKHNQVKLSLWESNVLPVL